MAGRLPRSFYARSALRVAPELLGRVLVRRLADGTRLAARLVETEAYLPDDPASHAFRGPTRRNEVMFGPPGRLYVYFTYGNHWMMNAVTGRAGEGTAVLLRAAEPLQGLEVMAGYRGRDHPRDLCSGPGKLAKAFGISGVQNGHDLVVGSDLYVLEGRPVTRSHVSRTTRVGVTRGAERRWRFIVTEDPFVSRARPSRA